MGEVVSFGERKNGPERARSIIENIIRSTSYKDNILTMDWYIDDPLSPDRDDLEITFNKLNTDDEMRQITDSFNNLIRQYLISDPIFSAQYQSVNTLFVDKNKARLLFFKQ